MIERVAIQNVNSDWKSKRHTEHFSHSTQNSPWCDLGAHRRFTTPLICTKEVLTLSWIKINDQIKCYCVWSFFERNVFCVHYWWGRERRKGVSYRLQLVSSARKQQSNTNLFHLRHSHLLLSRYISPSPRCQSAPVFSFHRSFCSSSSLTIDMKEKKDSQRLNPPLNTPTLPCINS